MSKNYYKILNLEEFSSIDDVKKAYRKLARSCHPDVAGNSPEAVSRFKEINEAYQFLSDANKKAIYDKSQKFYSYAKETYTTNYGSYKKTYNSNSTNPNASDSSYKKTYTSNQEEHLTSFWREIFAQNKKENSKAPKKGEDINTDIEISAIEAYSGTTKIINMLQTQSCPKCAGRKFIDGQLCSCCKGKGEISDYKRFNVKIPAGIKDKSKIRLAGEGEKSKFGGASGDLYITIHINSLKNYKIDGINVQREIAITPFEAVLGADIVISTISGNVSIKIAPNTQNGQKIRLAGCGLKQNNKIGDMIVTVEIQTPKNLTNEEICLYKRLKEISSSSLDVR